jgi:hypothetical protein
LCSLVAPLCANGLNEIILCPRYSERCDREHNTLRYINIEAQHLGDFAACLSAAPSLYLRRKLYLTPVYGIAMMASMMCGCASAVSAPRKIGFNVKTLTILMTSSNEQTDIRIFRVSQIAGRTNPAGNFRNELFFLVVEKIDCHLAGEQFDA